MHDNAMVVVAMCFKTAGCGLEQHAAVFVLKSE